MNVSDTCPRETLTAVGIFGIAIDVLNCVGHINLSDSSVNDGSVDGSSSG